VAAAQDQGPTVKPFAVTARRFAFDPPRIEVNQDDLVKIELRTDDIAHSLTLDEYRIAKRVGPGHRSPSSSAPTAPAPSRTTANLQTEDGCRRIAGELVVRPRR